MTVTMKELGIFLVGLVLLGFGAAEFQSHQAVQPSTRSEIEEAVPEVTGRQCQLGQTQLHRDW